VAAVTFEGDFLIFLTAHHPVGTYHDAGPAAHALLLFPSHRSLVISIERSGDASVEARCGVAMAAGYGYVMVLNALDE